ncbi:hypothetical protein MRX96_023412 [Rhipicephalus microplus]
MWCETPRAAVTCFKIYDVVFRRAILRSGSVGAMRTQTHNPQPTPFLLQFISAIWPLHVDDFISSLTETRTPSSAPLPLGTPRTSAPRGAVRRDVETAELPISRRSGPSD